MWYTLDPFSSNGGTPYANDEIEVGTVIHIIRPSVMWAITGKVMEEGASLGTFAGLTSRIWHASCICGKSAFILVIMSLLPVFGASTPFRNRIMPTHYMP